MGIFAGRGDDEHPFGLEEFQGIGRPARAFFLGEGEDLVLEIGLAEVEETLAGHCRVGDAHLFGHHLKHRFHQRRFARRAGGLDQHGQEFIELAAHAGEVADEKIRGLADDPAAREVIHQALDQVRITQEVEGVLFFVG